MDAVKVTASFKLLANDTRLRLLRHLVRTGETTVTDLGRTLNMKSQAVSSHLVRRKVLWRGRPVCVVVQAGRPHHKLRHDERSRRAPRVSRCTNDRKAAKAAKTAKTAKTANRLRNHAWQCWQSWQPSWKSVQQCNIALKKELPPEGFRSVRDLIERKVKELLTRLG